jgi:hypothetical protein
VELPEEFFLQLKTTAVWKNVSVKTYVMQALIEKMTREGKYKS